METLVLNENKGLNERMLRALSNVHTIDMGEYFVTVDRSSWHDIRFEVERHFNFKVNPKTIDYRYELSRFMDFIETEDKIASVNFHVVFTDAPSGYHVPSIRVDDVGTKEDFYELVGTDGSLRQNRNLIVRNMHDVNHCLYAIDYVAVLATAMREAFTEKDRARLNAFFGAPHVTEAFGYPQIRVLRS